MRADEKMEKAMTPGPNRIIEPEIKNEKKCFKSAKNSIDFSIWEGIYGRSLNEVERVEIRENSKALLKILLSEHRRRESRKGKSHG